MERNDYVYKIVTRNLFIGGFFRPFLFFLFSLSSFPFPLFLPPRSGPWNPAKGLGGLEEHLLAPPAGENDICSRWWLRSKYTEMRLQPSPSRWHIFGVLEPMERV